MLPAVDARGLQVGLSTKFGNERKKACFLAEML